MTYGKELVESGVRSKCGMCGYVGTLTDWIGQCPRCRWDELRPAESGDRDPINETPALGTEGNGESGDAA